MPGYVIIGENWYLHRKAGMQIICKDREQNTSGSWRPDATAKNTRQHVYTEKPNGTSPGGTWNVWQNVDS